MNLPNQLTCARLGLTALFVAVLSVPGFPGQWAIALVLFIVASITELLDGYVARKYSLVTDFGKLMDPLADKILTGSVFIVLTAHGAIAAWVTIVIIAREFLVTGLRLLASAKGAVLAADKLGKWKTTFQISTAIYFLVMSGAETGDPVLSPIAAILAYAGPILGVLLLAATLLLTVISGLSYLLKNRELVKSA